MKSRQLKWAPYSLAGLMAVCGAAQAAEGGLVLEEIIVTAQKRSESLQDVPVAVSAFTSQTRDLIGITSVQDFTNFTPGITYTVSTDRMFVRGIGRYTNNLATSPGVATYGDGFYNSSNHQADSSPLFTNRVEVLRGPQGTLYGRNSIGGALNVLSPRPTDTFQGEIRAAGASLGREVIEGMVRGPITDSIGFLVGAGKYYQKDGFVENIAGDDLEGKQNNIYATAQLSFKFGDAADLWIKYAYAKWDEGWGTSVNISPLVTTTNNACTATVQTGGICASLVNRGSLGPSALYNTGFGRTITGASFPLAPANAQYTIPNPAVLDHRLVNQDTPAHETLDPDHQVVVEGTIHLGWADLKYLGGYHEYLYKLTGDFDNSTRTSFIYTPPFPAPNGSPVEIFTQVQSLYVEDKKYYSNEVNLTSTSDSKLQWIVGAYQYHEKYSQPVSVASPNQAQLLTPRYSPALAAPGNPDQNYSYTNAEITNTSLAGFAQIDYSFTDAWKATLGARYTKDKKYGDEFARYIFWDPGLQGGVAQVFDISATQFGINGGVPTANGQYTRHLSNDWDAVTGTAGIDWKPNDTGLGYLKYTRGYKDGGLNAGSIVAFPYTDPEYVNAYELGWKQDFGNRFQLNASVFYYDYKAAQIPLSVPQATGPNISQTFNINSKSAGVELESIWQATDALRFLLNYSYLDTKLEDGGCYEDALDIVTTGPRPCLTSGGKPGQAIDGNRVPGSPRNKVAFNTLYTIDFTPGSLILSGSWTWRDTTYSSIFNRTEWLAPSFDQTDFRATWQEAQNRYSIIAYIRNTFDDEGFDSVSAASSASGITRNLSLTPPRQYGLELQYRFGNK